MSHVTAIIKSANFRLGNILAVKCNLEMKIQDCGERNRNKYG